MLNKIIDLNKFESIFIEELEEYYNISNSIKDVQKWLDKVELYFELNNLFLFEHYTKQKIDFSIRRIKMPIIIDIEGE